MKFTPQHDQMDCGPSCIKMIANNYGKNYSLNFLRDQAYITREGVSLLGIVEASKKIGLETFSAKLSIVKLKENTKLFPCILHWNQNHFVVLQKISKRRFSKKRIYLIADPAHGLVKLTEEKFLKSWYYQEDKGIVLFLNPTEEFYVKEIPQEEEISVKYLFSSLRPYKKKIIIMFILLLIGSGLTLLFPFLTEALIDKGVSAKDINLIFIILLAQLGVATGTLTIEIFRNWLLLYVGTHLSIDIISSFLKKLIQLPVKFFDTKTMGDFNQRIHDNNRIEEFLTSQSLSTFFSIITFSVYFGVLFHYDLTILLVYLGLTAIAICWSFYWLKKRKNLDYYSFQQRSENQESIYELLSGINEMKLNQFEEFKRKEWEAIQQKLFKIKNRILKIDQIQLSGFQFLNQLKNIIVTYLAAGYVINGNMTLGALLSISYIIGQMNSPVLQLVSFFKSLQDAKLSLERLNEVQQHKNEEDPITINNNITELSPLPTLNKDSLKNDMEAGIRLENVSFQYEGPKSLLILNNINIHIPEGTITAVVGASGSGKTTLLKILLRFYDPTEGKIFYNNTNTTKLSPKSIRENCGVVMQDGFIFSDTIERNIATGSEKIDSERLKHALKVANLENFIISLPLGTKTKIGAAGNGISGGQKQRVLIARAIYKNPKYIYLDEATSALDAENERIIHDNLQVFFKGRTVLIIAHRLSTVKNADHIIVLKNGQIVEQGNHLELVSSQSIYYNLVKNQLELGS